MLLPGVGALHMVVVLYFLWFTAGLYVAQQPNTNTTAVATSFIHKKGSILVLSLGRLCGVLLLFINTKNNGWLPHKCAMLYCTPSVQRQQR